MKRTLAWGILLGLLVACDGPPASAPAAPPKSVRTPDPPRTEEPTAPPAASPDTKLLGLPIDHGLKALRLVLEEHFVIQEPPGIARGIQGRDSQGEELWLYVDRKDLGFRESGKWTLEEFRPLSIIGIARRRGKAWLTCGQVIPYYH